MDGARQLKECLRAPQLSSEQKVRRLLGDEAQMRALTALLQRQPDFDAADRGLTLGVVAMENGPGAAELDCGALRAFLGDVGEVEAVAREGAGFRVTFATAVQAQLALYAYHDLELPELGLRLLAARAPAAEPPRPARAAEPGKLTCRYDINIDNERQFEVSKRIIGAQGCHMKTILQSVQAETQCREKDVKLRLRGRGSNFQEGPEKRECDDKLHLCVSAKTKAVFDSTCAHVERLLAQVFEDYVAFAQRARGGGPPLNADRFRFQRID